MRHLFVLLLGVALTGCAQPVNRATKGGLAGGALGAGLGAIIGNQVGDPGAGTAIGAAAGTIGGAMIGNSLDAEDRDTQNMEGQLIRNQELIDENRRLIEELRSRGADVHASERGVVINLPDILFRFDRSELTREAERTVAEISDVLRDVPDRSLAIEGHTDSVGTVVYNKNLSNRRAGSVARELERNGLPSRRMRVTGFGEGSPIATNNSEAGRARNRRVEVIIENN